MCANVYLYMCFVYVYVGDSVCGKVSFICDSLADSPCICSWLGALMAHSSLAGSPRWLDGWIACLLLDGWLLLCSLLLYRPQTQDIIDKVEQAQLAVDVVIIVVATVVVATVVVAVVVAAAVVMVMMVVVVVVAGDWDS